MGDRVRIGGHVDLSTIRKVLGFQPEVGESFEIEGILMRVLSRTMGLREDEAGEEEWFDWLFVATTEDVDDADEMVRRVKEAFGFDLPEQDEDEADARVGRPSEASGADGDNAEDEDAEAGASSADESDESDEGADSEAASPLELGDRVLRQIEDILRAA